MMRGFRLHDTARPAAPAPGAGWALPSLVWRLRRDSRAVAALEYALIAAILIVLLTTTLTALNVDPSRLRAVFDLATTGL